MFKVNNKDTRTNAGWDIVKAYFYTLLNIFDEAFFKIN